MLCWFLLLSQKEKTEDDKKSEDEWQLTDAVPITETETAARAGGPGVFLTHANANTVAEQLDDLTKHIQKKTGHSGTIRAWTSASGSGACG